MRVKVSSASELTLEAAEDISSLEVTVSSELDDARLEELLLESSAGVPSGHHVWLAEEWLTQRYIDAVGKAKGDDLKKMLSSVEKYGWYAPDLGLVKAHITDKD